MEAALEALRYLLNGGKPMGMHRPAHTAYKVGEDDKLFVHIPGYGVLLLQAINFAKEEA